MGFPLWASRMPGARRAHTCVMWVSLGASPWRGVSRVRRAFLWAAHSHRLLRGSILGGKTPHSGQQPVQLGAYISGAAGGHREVSGKVEGDA